MRNIEITALAPNVVSVRRMPMGETDILIAPISGGVVLFIHDDGTRPYPAVGKQLELVHDYPNGITPVLTWYPESGRTMLDVIRAAQHNRKRAERRHAARMAAATRTADSPYTSTRYADELPEADFYGE